MTLVVAAYLPGFGSVAAGDGIGHNMPSGTVNSHSVVKWLQGPPGGPGGPWALGFAGDQAYMDIVAPALAALPERYGQPLPGEAGARLIARAVRDAVTEVPGVRPVFVNDDDNIPDWGVAPIIAHSSGVWQLCSDLIHLYPGLVRNGVRFVSQGHARDVASGAMWQASGWSETSNPLAVVRAGMEAAAAIVIGIGGECFFLQLPEQG